MELRFFSQMEVDIIACVSLFRRRGFVQQLVFVVPRSTVFVDLFYEWSVSCRGEVVRVGSARPVHDHRILIFFAICHLEIVPYKMRETSLTVLIPINPAPPFSFTHLTTSHPPPHKTTTMATNWATELFGPKILTKPKTTGLPTESRFGGKSSKKLVALYFSASW